MENLEEVTLEAVANKQRILGNDCYFGWEEICLSYDPNNKKCSKGLYNHCLQYQALLIKISKNKK